jgi:hypothetical protein
MVDNARKNRVYGLRNALQKLSSLPVVAQRNPSGNDTKFSIGTLWIDQASNRVWTLTSVSSGSAVWSELTSGSPAPEIEFLTGDAGGPVGPDGANNVNIVGGVGIATNGIPGTNTITIATTSVVTPWSREAGTTVAMLNDRGYINTNVALTTLTLPATGTVGDYIEICGEGAGGWTIAQNAGQSIQHGATSTTVGVGGSLSSTNQYDTVRLVCRIANTTWSVLSNIGVLNIA